MEIREYLRVLRRRAWIPALLVVVTVAATAVFVYLAKPQYQATATVIAEGSGSPQALNFQDIASSNNVALKVNLDLALPESPGDTAGRIQVASSRTNLYRITATDADPGVAVKIANAAAKDSAALYQQLAGPQTSVADDPLQKSLDAALQVYSTAVTNLANFNAAHPKGVSPTDAAALAQQLELQFAVQAEAQDVLSLHAGITSDQVSQVTTTRTFQVTVVDNAVAVPDTTGRYLKLLYAAVFALVLGVALIFALEYMDNSIREPEEVEQLLGAPVIAVIPRVTARALRPARERG